MPTIHAILPDIVPQSVLPRAIAAAATAQQTAVICGPAIGGFLYLARSVGGLRGLCRHSSSPRLSWSAGLETTYANRDRAPMSLHPVRRLRLHSRPPSPVRRHLARSLCCAARRRHRADADLCTRHPETGPWGLGLLRSAPAIGAISISALWTTARRPQGVTSYSPRSAPMDCRSPCLA